jgi:hypothetical protein
MLHTLLPLLATNAIRSRPIRVSAPTGCAAFARDLAVVAHFFRGSELVIEYFGELPDERGWAPPLDEPPTSTVPAMNI